MFELMRVFPILVFITFIGFFPAPSAQAAQAVVGNEMVSGKGVVIKADKHSLGRQFLLSDIRLQYDRQKKAFPLELEWKFEWGYELDSALDRLCERYGGTYHLSSIQNLIEVEKKYQAALSKDLVNLAWVPKNSAVLRVQSLVCSLEPF